MISPRMAEGVGEVDMDKPQTGTNSTNASKRVTRIPSLSPTYSLIEDSSSTVSIILFFLSLSLSVLSFLSHARMSTIFRRHSTIICFFCNSAVTPAPRDPRSFRCPHCDCWNRFDRNGEPISDEPAMHDENLNVPSFAKRGMCGQMLN